MSHCPQKSIRLTKNITQIKDKASNKIIIISLGKIIYSKEFKIINLKNFRLITLKSIKRILKNNQETGFDLIQPLRHHVLRPRMSFLRLRIILILQIIVKEIRHMKKSIFLPKYKLQPSIIGQLLFQIPKASHNCIIIVIFQPKKT